MDDSRLPELEDEKLISEVVHSSLKGYEPFYVTFFVKVNMKDFEYPKTKFDPDTINDEIKRYDGDHAMCNICYLASKEDYAFEIYVRDRKQRWTARTYPVHVDENPPTSLIKHFSIKPRIGLLDFNKQCQIDFDLVCDKNVKFVKWIYDERDLVEPKPEHGDVQQRKYTYRGEGTFSGRIEVYKQTGNSSLAEPEIRKFTIVVLDPNSFVTKKQLIS